MDVLDSFRLNGKRLLITGGSRGLGKQMALAVAQMGADVVLAARTPGSLEQTASEIRTMGRRVMTIVADMGDEDACTRACERALEEFGPIDTLINNVGGRRESTPVETQSIAEWHRLFGFNLTSCFVCTTLIGRSMIASGRGGRIINVASVSAWKVLRGMGGRHYEAGKAAVAQFTRCVAADWAPYGVNVNAICPGVFMTEANERWADAKPALINELLGQIPAKRFGRPKEIGPLTVYLASDASSYVTGSMFVIDGGFCLW